MKREHLSLDEYLEYRARTDIKNPSIDQIVPGMMIRTHDIAIGATVVETIDPNLDLVTARCFVGGTLECSTVLTVAEIAVVWSIGESYEGTMEELQAFGEAVHNTLTEQEELLK